MELRKELTYKMAIFVSVPRIVLYHVEAEFLNFFLLRVALLQNSIFLDSGYHLCLEAAGQGIRFWTIGFILSIKGHAKDVPFVGELFSVS